MNIAHNDFVGEVVATDYRTAAVFQKFGIDFCCKGNRSIELEQVLALFLETAGELTAHMKKEEFILFPFIRKMAKAELDHGQIARPHFATVENPVAMMKHDHDQEGERFAKIASLTDNYTAPSDACNTYRVTFALLKEFEADLHMHIHLENNILFPRAIEMEKRVFEAAL